MSTDSAVSRDSVVSKRRIPAKPSIWKKCCQRWQLFLFLLLPLTYIVVFKYVPMFGIQIAFKDFSPSKGIWGSPFVGLKHFRTFFSSYQAGRVILNTLRLSFYGLLVGFPMAIIFALQLNLVRNLRFKKFAQTVTYIPHFISTVVIVGMLFTVLGSVNGLYGNFYKLITGTLPRDIFGTASNFPHIYVWSGLWQGLGWSSIIYIAALSGVDPQLHEAAEIDGANRLQRLWHIDLACILPTASVLLILDSGSIMSVGFEKAYLLQNAVNTSYSEIISTYVYKVGLNSASNFSYGTAIDLFNSVVNCCMLVLVNWLSKKLSDNETSLW